MVGAAATVPPEVGAVAVGVGATGVTGAAVGAGATGCGAAAVAGVVVAGAATVVGAVVPGVVVVAVVGAISEPGTTPWLAISSRAASLGGRMRRAATAASRPGRTRT